MIVDDSIITLREDNKVYSPPVIDPLKSAPCSPLQGLMGGRTIARRKSTCVVDPTLFAHSCLSLLAHIPPTPIDDSEAEQRHVQSSTALLQQKAKAPPESDATSDETQHYLDYWATQTPPHSEPEELVNRIMHFFKEGKEGTLHLSFLSLYALPPVFHISHLVNHLLGISFQNSNLTEFPKEILGLKFLKSLDLSNNPNLTRLPSSVGGFANLQRLSLNHTGISTLPEKLQKLEHLTDLNLNHTPLSELPPWIEKLIRLKNLFLKKTRITHLPQEINRLSKLEYLDLRKNPQLMAFPWIGELTRLRGLYLDHTGLTELPPGVDTLKNLKYLYVFESSIPGPISLKIWQLRDLYLSSSFNQVRYEISSSIAELKHAYRVCHHTTDNSYTLEIRIERPTLTQYADEHLHMLGRALRALQQKTTAPFLHISVKYLNESFIHPDTQAREFFSTLLPYFIHQDAGQPEEARLFVGEKGKHTLKLLPFTRYSLRKMQLCRDIGTFLNAVGTCFIPYTFGKIGSIFSDSFYTHLALLASSTCTYTLPETLSADTLSSLKVLHLRSLAWMMAQYDDESFSLEQAQQMLETAAYEKYKNSVAPLSAVITEISQLMELASTYQLPEHMHEPILPLKKVGKILSILVQGTSENAEIKAEIVENSHKTHKTPDIF